MVSSAGSATSPISIRNGPAIFVPSRMTCTAFVVGLRYDRPPLDNSLKWVHWIKPYTPAGAPGLPSGAKCEPRMSAQRAGSISTSLPIILSMMTWSTDTGSGCGADPSLPDCSM